VALVAPARDNCAVPRRARASRPRPRRRTAATTVALVVTVAVLTTACGGDDTGDAARPTTGKGIYVANCATCHGVDGQGGVGPRLAGVAARYPDVGTQIAVVTNGLNRMPAFRGRLTESEIRAVVDYTRTDLKG
jgi:mono/diheme cytochrome c family protein